MSDTSKDETVVTEPSKTEATPPVTPPEVKTEDPAVVQLRKEKEQAEMRANQLQNQLKAKEEADAKAKEKELEEQNQFKELHEQEKAKREALEAEIATKEKTAELDKAKTEVLGEYSEKVKALAEGVGLTLSDTDESSVAAFKEKLDKINAEVVSTDNVGPNNGRPTNEAPTLSGDDLQRTLNDEKGFHEYVTKKYPGIAAMTGPRK